MAKAGGNGLLLPADIRFDRLPLAGRTSSSGILPLSLTFKSSDRVGTAGHPLPTAAMSGEGPALQNPGLVLVTGFR
ncbi:hypothetical protein [Bradyrhizobium sp. NAS96.2]|uniref:hypothetical protein n=1 Tax=Bradyrhizobium sp. NAS96.2 TaxID=1680160 RepID=UPI00093B3649|nr:hypothetical protein [Bradyrhizobium sp. NAS96.2]OKO82727.1 hypothetical protein AC628_03615 [Bradyrhizobium sp. NAS96.2]